MTGSRRRGIYQLRGILLVHKKKYILEFVTTWIKLKSIMLKAEEKDKHYMVSLIVESRKIKEIETNS